MRQAAREPGRRERAWDERDTRRRSAAERGYDARWEHVSQRYRRQHPLCVSCALAGRVRPSRCVDHIVPAHSVPSLFWDEHNYAALCLGCHARKTREEPQHTWEPRDDRLVVCGLPGTGKTWYARSKGWPCWDVDDRPELVTIEAIVAARDEWIREQRGACVVIVASIVTASIIAGRIAGRVWHTTDRFVDRPPPAIARQACRG